MGKTGSEKLWNAIDKMTPLSPETNERYYQERNYTNDQLVTKHYRQKEKELEAQASLASNMFNPFARGPKEKALERRQNKRLATENMLKKQCVPTKNVTMPARLSSYGAGVPGLKKLFGK